jgi:hypothetical protein
MRGGRRAKKPAPLPDPESTPFPDKRARACHGAERAASAMGATRAPRRPAVNERVEDVTEMQRCAVIRRLDIVTRRGLIRSSRLPRGWQAHRAGAGAAP